MPSTWTAGSETQVNTYTTASQAHPAVAALAGGGYVITWQSYNQDGSGNGIYAQRYDAGGVAQGVSPVNGCLLLTPCLAVRTNLIDHKESDLETVAFRILS